MSWRLSVINTVSITCLISDSDKDDTGLTLNTPPPSISLSLSGVPDYFDRNKISSGGDLSHYSSASLY